MALIEHAHNYGNEFPCEQNSGDVRAITNTQCCQSVIRNICKHLFVDLISLNIPMLMRYFPPALYTLPEYVPTGGGCFMSMACSTLYE